MKQENFKNVPGVGQIWPGQGGFNGGLVPARGDVPEHYLIIAAADIGDHEFGGYREESKSTSKTDGKANTEWLCNEETQHPAANACAEYKADGHHDFYLPAAAELYHCWVNCPEVFAKDCYYWSSSQRSAYSAFLMYFGDGYQVSNVKDYELRVRPVRRLFIQPSDNSDLTEWNGEGLPPIGTVCEWLDSSCDRWLPVSIAYLSSWLVVIRDEKNHPDGSVEIAIALSTDPDKQPKFREVRTPEQIAAEEREAAINTMCDLLGTPRGTVAAGVVMRLYDAGCRMQVTE